MRDLLRRARRPWYRYRLRRFFAQLDPSVPKSAADLEHEARLWEKMGEPDMAAMLRSDDLKAPCNGLCLSGAEVGVPGRGIAYPHPECPAHGAYEAWERWRRGRLA